MPGANIALVGGIDVLRSSEKTNEISTYLCDILLSRFPMRSTPSSEHALELHYPGQLTQRSRLQRQLMQPLECDAALRRKMGGGGGGDAADTAT